MNEKDYKTFFKGKKITLMGLGLLGRGVNLAKFFSKYGAVLTITDLKSAQALGPSLRQLRAYPNIRFVLGGHNIKDFRNCDLVIKAAGVPLDSPYIKEAKKNKIPVEMDASLFSRFSPAFIIGVTGTRGKTTTAYLLYHILKLAQKDSCYGQVYLAGNVRGLATLPLLSQVKEDDLVILELDSWQLQGFGDLKFSPPLAIFTNFMPDHLNYYKNNLDKYFCDKANIFKYQKRGDTLILGEKLVAEFKKRKIKIRSHQYIAKKTDLSRSWKIKILGEHNKDNIACVVRACYSLGLSDSDIKEGLETFLGVPGRLELVRTLKGVKYYNDTTATTPEAVMAALKALQASIPKLSGGILDRRIILIAGGADKNLEYARLVALVNKTVKALVCFKGEATTKILAQLPTKLCYSVRVVSSMKEALEVARKCTGSGDIVLLSPGAASFGMFKNEYDRGEQFVKIVKKLK